MKKSMKDTLAISFLLLLISGCEKAPVVDFEINVIYDEGLSYQDFEANTSGHYIMTTENQDVLQAIVDSESTTSPNQAGKNGPDFQPDISGNFTTKKSKLNTNFFVYVVEFDKQKEIFDALTFYVDDESGKIVGISCPNNRSIRCVDIEYPYQRGGSISFGRR